MNKMIRTVGQILGILFLVAGTLNLMFALRGESAYMALPLLQAGAWGALGCALLAGADVRAGLTRARTWLLCGLGIMSGACCVGGNLLLWEVLRNTN